MHKTVCDNEFDEVCINYEDMPDHEYAKRIKFLDCHNNEDTFKQFIVSESAFDSYLNFERLCNTKQAIKEKIASKATKKYTIDLCKSVYNKVLLIRQFEEHHEIDPLNIANFTYAEDKNPDESLCSQIRSRFRLKNVYDVKDTYIKMLKNICSGIMDKTSEAKRKQENGNRTREYLYDAEALELYLKLLENRLISQEVSVDRASLINTLYRIKIIKKFIKNPTLSYLIL